MVVAIDGPAGAGKSTVARALARELGFGYLDSGALYRSVGLLSLRAPGRPPGRLARQASIELTHEDPGDLRVLLDGEDITGAIRTPEVSEAASRVAADPDVREALLGLQRNLLATGDWIAEGRDIGSVVAPDSDLKVFLTADARERARRRAQELRADEATILAEQTLRDERDSSREHSPLRPAEGAAVVDTTGLEVGEVVSRIAELVRSSARGPR